MDYLWTQLRAGGIALSIMCSVVIGLWLLKVSGIGLAKMTERLLLPLERRVYQWLQDRAMSRALGIPVEIVRVRRRIEMADKPINVPTADGSKHQR